MQQRKVYPSGRASGRWLGYIMLIMAAIIVISGMMSQKKQPAAIVAIPTATPLPLDEAFDETMTTLEWQLPSVEWYALQLGAFDQEESAKALSRQYQSRGAAGYLWQDDRYRVLAAVYASEEDARNVRQQISQQHAVESYLYKIALQPLPVSIHGMQGQIEILQAAFMHSCDLIASLQDWGIRCDRADLSREKLLDELNGLSSQTQLISARMQQRFPKPRAQSVANLILLLDDYSLFCNNVSTIDTQVQLGSALKHQTIKTLDLLRQVYDILGNT